MTSKATALAAGAGAAGLIWGASYVAANGAKAITQRYSFDEHKGAYAGTGMTLAALDGLSVVSLILMRQRFKGFQRAGGSMRPMAWARAGMPKAP
mmetsp:Transcript_22731/g.79463  ORF Transcript_22731/g.79463 Transcript_22731/m.79463 type:complete len:95 (-) Transcript_22731:201-485(-)|eukprot:CAMPEP_0203813618 /NCGR_PEP_ID=MMETSP0115-20131106/4818_1 /ASSEMBLY_ACC=CAM_ASM_000227 /TAXON_ID=33651 /ORGANISM="Bicosoecid sp, Strain ms1" /LENGTH=94 /DNA_ID=CAMNT_0050722491 /DNA_START=119 /DNA_END=403 /DNA_ORIENTATION=+